MATETWYAKRTWCPSHRIPAPHTPRLYKVFEHFEARCGSIHVIPFEPHLAEGSVFDVGVLRPATTQAASSWPALCRRSSRGSAHQEIFVDSSTHEYQRRNRTLRLPILSTV